MPNAIHDELLQHTSFLGDKEAGSRDGLQVVEMWKYSGVDEIEDGENFRCELLPQAEIELWLAGQGRRERPKPAHSNTALEGGIRLLLCERTSYRPPGFAMTREGYLAVEKAFNLPQNTLEATFNYQGTFSKQFRYTEKEVLKTINFVLKVPQKMPIANYILAMSHDIATGMTTALIHGTFLNFPLPTMKCSLVEAPRNQDFLVTTHDKQATQSSQIISRLRCSISDWANPILLPIILLENYQIRSHLFAHDLADKVVELERQTGVVFAGRTVSPEEFDIHPENIPKVGIRKLTQDMHTLLTEIIFYERVAEWSFDCANFLDKSTTQLRNSALPENKKSLVGETRETLETIEYLTASCKSMLGFQRSAKERVQSQIGVLYSFTAQIDNSINAKIAVSSARDSSAMKTLALITTVFLPGTYIATLFSMSMFDWSYSGHDSSGIVSRKFWIYWAVTIPLTLLVMILWRAWWIWQERLYKREVDEAVASVDDDTQSKTNLRTTYAQSYNSSVMQSSREASGAGSPGWARWGRPAVSRVS